MSSLSSALRQAGWIQDAGHKTKAESNEHFLLDPAAAVRLQSGCECVTQTRRGYNSYEHYNMPSVRLPTAGLSVSATAVLSPYRLLRLATPLSRTITALSFIISPSYITTLSRFARSNQASGKLIHAVFLGGNCIYRTSKNPPRHTSNMLSVSVEGILIEALVDTGASITIIRADVCKRLRKVTTPY